MADFAVGPGFNDPGGAPFYRYVPINKTPPPQIRRYKNGGKLNSNTPCFLLFRYNGGLSIASSLKRFEALLEKYHF